MLNEKAVITFRMKSGAVIIVKQAIEISLLRAMLDNNNRSFLHIETGDISFSLSMADIEIVEYVNDIN